MPALDVLTAAQLFQLPKCGNQVTLLDFNAVILEKRHYSFQLRFTLVALTGRHVIAQHLGCLVLVVQIFQFFDVHDVDAFQGL